MWNDLKDPDEFNTPQDLNKKPLDQDPYDSLCWGMWDNIAGGATGAARAAWRQIFPLEMYGWSREDGEFVEHFINQRIHS